MSPRSCLASPEVFHALNVRELEPLNIGKGGNQRRNGNGRRSTLERTYLFQCFVVHKTGSILGDFELALLYLLAELPAGYQKRLVELRHNSSTTGHTLVKGVGSFS